MPGRARGRAAASSLATRRRPDSPSGSAGFPLITLPGRAESLLVNDWQREPWRQTRASVPVGYNCYRPRDPPAHKPLRLASTSAPRVPDHVPARHAPLPAWCRPGSVADSAIPAVVSSMFEPATGFRGRSVLDGGKGVIYSAFSSAEHRSSKIFPGPLVPRDAYAPQYTQVTSVADVRRHRRRDRGPYGMLCEVATRRNAGANPGLSRNCDRE